MRQVARVSGFNGLSTNDSLTHVRALSTRPWSKPHPGPHVDKPLNHDFIAAGVPARTMRFPSNTSAPVHGMVVNRVDGVKAARTCAPDRGNGSSDTSNAACFSPSDGKRGMRSEHSRHQIRPVIHFKYGAQNNDAGLASRRVSNDSISPRAEDVYITQLQSTGTSPFALVSSFLGRRQRVEFNRVSSSISANTIKPGVHRTKQWSARKDAPPPRR